jgi:hypothetical protein
LQIRDALWIGHLGCCIYRYVQGISRQSLLADVDSVGIDTGGGDCEALHKRGKMKRINWGILVRLAPENKQRYHKEEEMP